MHSSRSFRAPTLVLAALAAMCVATRCSAMVALWNFNSAVADADTSTGSLAPSLGAGSASPLLTTGSFIFAEGDSISTDPAPTGDDSAWLLTDFAAQGTGNKSRGVQFNVSTVGFENIAVSWDQLQSSRSARDVQFQYTVNGSTWVDFALFSDTTTSWSNGRSVDLSSIAAVNHNANFGVRMVAAFEPLTTQYRVTSSSSAYLPTHTWRLDMVAVNGTPLAAAAVPEASAMLLAAAALLATSALAARRAGSQES